MLERKYVEGAYLPLFTPRYNTATTIWDALDAGILSGKYLDATPESGRYTKKDRWSAFYGSIPQWKHDTVRCLKDFVEGEGLACSLTNLALAWTLKNDDVTVVVLGARNAEQLNTTFRCLEAVKELDDARMEKIEKILKNKPEKDMNLYNTYGRATKNFRKKSML